MVTLLTIHAVLGTEIGRVGVHRASHVAAIGHLRVHRRRTRIAAHLNLRRSSRRPLCHRLHLPHQRAGSDGGRQTGAGVRGNRHLREEQHAGQATSQPPDKAPLHESVPDGTKARLAQQASARREVLVAENGIGVSSGWLLGFNEEFAPILRPAPLARCRSRALAVSVPTGRLCARDEKLVPGEPQAVLRALVKAQDAALPVMGAFEHSRLR